MATDEELTEVPFYGAWGGGLGAGERGIEGMLVVSFDMDFVEEGKGDGVFRGAELFNFGIGSRFLGTEVIAGEAEDDEALVVILAGERFEGGVLGSEATIGGDIDDEESFACVRFEGGGLAVDVAEGDIVERGIFSEGDDGHKE